MYRSLIVQSSEHFLLDKGREREREEKKIVRKDGFEDKRTGDGRKGSKGRRGGSFEEL